MIENNDEKIINIIRSESNSIEIPPELEPEKVMNNITLVMEKKKKRRGKQIYKYALTCVASLALIILLVTTYIANNSNTTEILTNSAKEGVTIASSYKEIYELLKSVSGAREDTVFGMDTGNMENTSNTLSDYSVQSKEFSQTNIQVEGVDEGDVVKTDGNFIYVLERENNRLRIIDASSDKLNEVSQINLEYGNEKTGYPSEFYIKNNLLTLIYVTSENVNISTYDSASYKSTSYESQFYNSQNSDTVIKTYNIESKSSPEETGSVYQEGNYVSSRMIGDIVYVISDYSIYSQTIREDDCVPSINGNPIEIDSVYISDNTTNPSYNVLTSLDINNPTQYMDTKTILGNYPMLYVSNNNIYIATNIYVETENGGYNETEIIKLSYQSGIIEGVATARIMGMIKDSFCLDEYDGKLRLVSTINTYNNTMVNPQEPVSDSIGIEVNSTSSNNLYVLDENLNIIGKIENIAEDEQIYSARFMGETGYFVTFKNVDPLFAVDLSNPSDPKILGELKITGFSEYLHFWSENLLLGIGKEINPETNEIIGLKLSMFDISDPSNVIETNKVVLEKYDYSYVDLSHKSILVDSSKNLIGFVGQMGYENGFNTDYLLYSYDDTQGFGMKLKENINSNNVNSDYYYDQSNIRGLYINDLFYLVQPSLKINVYGMEGYNLIEELSLQ